MDRGIGCVLTQPPEYGPRCVTLKNQMRITGRR